MRCPGDTNALVATMTAALGATISLAQPIVTAPAAESTVPFAVAANGRGRRRCGDARSDRGVLGSLPPGRLPRARDGASPCCRRSYAGLLRRGQQHDRGRRRRRGLCDGPRRQRGPGLVLHDLERHDRLADHGRRQHSSRDHLLRSDGVDGRIRAPRPHSRDDHLCRERGRTARPPRAASPSKRRLPPSLEPDHDRRRPLGARHLRRQREHGELHHPGGRPYRRPRVAVERDGSLRPGTGLHVPGHGD